MATSKKIKNMWRGKFVFGGSSRVLYAHAYTKKQAFMIMCRRISVEDNLPFFQVYNYFNHENSNVSLEIEYKELP